MDPRWAATTCFVLIAIMNLSAWIDLDGLLGELPLIVHHVPEGWTLPSSASLCISIANVAPALMIFLRWYQGKQFSEIPYIYIIIAIGFISCFILAFTWDRTTFIFGQERSLWLLACVFTLAMLDCTSSLVFFDYMKRFRSQYLTATFLGEGLTGIIPTLMLLGQGVGGEAICVPSINGTYVEPMFTQPRFSVRVYILLLAVIIGCSLISFILLRWTNIIAVANAAQPETSAVEELSIQTDIEEDSSITTIIDIPVSKPKIRMNLNMFIFMLLLNTFNSIILFGCLPSLTTYALLPYGQKTFYYSSMLTPLGYTLALIISARWTTLTTSATIIGSSIGFCLCLFVMVIAKQSPCPWWHDTIHGGAIMVLVWFVATVIIAYVRIAIGHRIKLEWEDEKGMFFFGVSIQLGLLLGSIPMYFLINVFGAFKDREPCHIYCST